MSKEIDVSKSVVYDYTNTKFNGLELGKTGYFSDEPSFVNYTIGQLSDINTTVPYRYKNSTNERFIYFIPEDKVVFKTEPKYKPYSFMYELPFYNVGSVIKVRNKNQELTTYVVVNSVSVDRGNKIFNIVIGTESGSPLYWFNNIEIYVNDKWQPFGIEE